MLRRSLPTVLPWLVLLVASSPASFAPVEALTASARATEAARRLLAMDGLG